jgi:protocatechuate 3,4-dioxygenase beta subunit
MQQVILRAVPHTLVEVWQCNAAGRYMHARDDHAAPLDPNFSGGGRMMTDAEGRYQFTTIKPGAYPWRNHHNAWRPAHIHFSLFGTSFQSRLVTQMYFPNDPLFPQQCSQKFGDDFTDELALRFTIDDGVNTPLVMEGLVEWECQGDDPEFPTELKVQGLLPIESLGPPEGDQVIPEE